MTNHRTIQPDARKVIVGVDTHKHVHVAVAIDTWGIRLGDRSCAADSDGYQQLITWAERHGRVAAFGIEGTGSYGAGLARAVRRAGHQVLEVNRGDRRTRRIAGKSDTVDVRRQINPDQWVCFVRETSCRFTVLRDVHRFSRLRCASVLRLTCSRRARIAGRRPA